jgi:hypothetical protein
MNTKQLLNELLATIDHSQIPAGLAEEVNEYVAKLGGCAFCRKPAEFYCDYKLGWAIAGWSGCDGATAAKCDRFNDYVPGKGLPCLSAESGYFTCDAPLCRDCATEKSRWFFDGPGCTEINTEDWCPFHNREPYDLTRLRWTNAEDAERERLRVWKIKLFGDIRHVSIINNAPSRKPPTPPRAA